MIQDPWQDRTLAQALQNRIPLQNYFLSSDFEAFAEHYNYQRYHKRLNNVIPADAYLG